jgi:hypothetical protein
MSIGKDPPLAPIKTNLAYTSQRSPLFFVPDLTPCIRPEIWYTPGGISIVGLRL